MTHNHNLLSNCNFSILPQRFTSTATDVFTVFMFSVRKLVYCVKMTEKVNLVYLICLVLHCVIMGFTYTPRITRATSVTVNTDSWLRVQITRWQWQSCVQLWYELWDRRILRGRYNPSSLWLAECHQIMNKPQLCGRFLNICYGWKLAISMYSLATSCWASKWFSQMSWKLVHSSSHDPLHCGMHAECSQQLLLSTYHYELENWDGVVWPTNLVYHHQPSSLSWSIITEP